MLVKRLFQNLDLINLPKKMNLPLPVLGLLFVGLILVSADIDEERTKEIVKNAIQEATIRHDEMMRQATINGAQTVRPKREAIKSTPATEAIGRTSIIYRKAFDHLITMGLLNRETALKELQRQLPAHCTLPKLTCDATAKYRTVNGTCNNIGDPYQGSINRHSLRLIDPDYKDGKQEPRGGGLLSSLPSARKVSRNVHLGSGNVYETNVTHMAAQFGQFLDHDITLTPVVNAGGCCKNSSGECWNINWTEADDHYDKNNVTCLEFTRSTESCFSSEGNEHREQFNGITAYIDGSVVYGSDDVLFKQLRRGFTGGKLVVNSEHANFLPWKSDAIPGGNTGEIIAGDVRANEMPGLTVLHTLFLREHNRIASELGELRKDWDDEMIFQETRRIIGAELQQITYGEFLPAILGLEAMKKYELELPKDHTMYTKYDPAVDATIFNSFATAAYRFGHTLVNGLIKLYLDNKVVGNYTVKENYLVSTQILNTINGVSGYDLILNGLIRQMSQAYDGEIHEDMTNNLFMDKVTMIGSDLAARNIQRGRDHGIPSYNKFREFCNLSSLPDSWDATPAGFTDASWDKLKKAGYSFPNDTDLYTGGLSETPVTASVSGPTFVCLQAIQFQRLMKGDRFFFTHGAVSGSFSQEQLVALRGRTLGDIICDNSVIKETPRNVFYVESQLNPMVLCNSASRKLDIKLFAETSPSTTEAITETSTTGAAAKSAAALTIIFIIAGVGNFLLILRIF